MNSNMFLSLAFWGLSLAAMFAGKNELGFYLILVAILNALISIAQMVMKHWQLDEGEDE